MKQFYTHTCRTLSLILWVGQSFYHLHAQNNQWNWPEDKKTAKEQYVLYTDALAVENYITAQKHLNWLLTHVPKLNKAIYQHGEIIYSKLAQQTEEPVAKAAYQEKAITMLQLREKYFGDPKTVANRQALLAYKFYKNIPEKQQETLLLIQRAITLNQEQVHAANLVGWLDLMRRQKQVNTLISDEDIIEAYSLATEILAQQAINSSKEKKILLNTYAKTMDLLLTKSTQVNCQFIENVLGKRMIASTKNNAQIDSLATSSDTAAARRAKMVLRLMKKHTCQNVALSRTAAKILYTTTPSVPTALLLARKLTKEKKYKEAVKYYQIAHTLSKNSTEKGEVYLEMAKVYATVNKITSRNYARKALQENPNMTQAYELIGSLYMSSYETCKQGTNRVADRAVFIAAYNMFKKADNVALVQKAKAQFPTAEQIFEVGLEEGAIVRVTCWINETVILKKAPKS